MIIRKAKVKEAHLVSELFAEFMKDHDAVVLKRDKNLKPHIEKKKNSQRQFQQYVAKCIKSKNAQVYVAEEDSKFVAYSLTLIKKTIPIFKIKELGYFADLYVKNQFRGKGISSKFRELAIKWFKKRGIKYTSIMVYHENKFAHSIYKKWGMFDYHIEMRGKI